MPEPLPQYDVWKLTAPDDQPAPDWDAIEAARIAEAERKADEI